jgi:pyrroline-5-carboxylate reductase
VSAAAGTLLLVGCGKMGGALAEGWLARGIARRIVVVEPGPGADALSGIERHMGAATVPADLAPEAVVLAVKPQTMAEVLPDYRRFAGTTTFLSIAAGKTLGFCARRLGPEAAIVRAMPNLPASIGHGMTVACANARVAKAGRALVDRLLAAVGDVAWVADESLLDAVTAVSGSGPAYIFLLIECLAAAGKAEGLPADLAARLATITAAGAGELARRSPQGAAALRAAVTSPGGTTEAALKVLMAADGLAPLMARAIAAATRRSRELAD